MTQRPVPAFAPGIELHAPLTPEFAEIVTPEAMEFVAALVRLAAPRRAALLQARAERQTAIDAGQMPDFLPETQPVRDSDWTVAPLPADLLDRRVEITGPTSDRKMVINALNSGAHVFMADFEDANTPSWANTINGQINMRDAIRRTISFANPDGRQYKLGEKPAVLIVRPRGWHLNEKHVHVDGEEIPGGLFDFGMYFFHNARELLARGSGPYFYLPKLESHVEARLWNDVFVLAQELLGLPQGTIKATVLIETILGAFEMDEILYELRDHSAGLNCGRWDYIFSCIKKLHSKPDFIFPDRAQVTMATHFMRSYSLLAIKTCHRRNVHAVGGMSAFIPVKNDEAANERAFAQVRADKEREATDGHDGTWVAHPGLVPVALEVFNRVMPQPNQIERAREDVQVSGSDLLDFVRGPITAPGLRTNINVGIQYIEAWLRGQGAVPIFNLMEDAATAEISRAQVWQWIRHPEGVLDDGRTITLELVRQMINEELDKVKAAIGAERYERGQFAAATALFDELIARDTFIEFLTLSAYQQID